MRYIVTLTFFTGVSIERRKMSSRLEQLKTEWDQFQQSNVEETATGSRADIAKELKTYKTIQQQTEEAYAQWQNDYAHYQTLLDNPSSFLQANKPLTKKTNSHPRVAELIAEHDELSQTIQRAIDRSSSTPSSLEALMQSWERLTVVHHHLSNIIATDC